MSKGTIKSSETEKREYDLNAWIKSSDSAKLER